MAADTTIHPFPELRALAEEEARAFAEAWGSACEADWLAWDKLNQMTRERRVKTHLTLLCDLTRPASRDAVARLVAEKVGGVSRPDFFLGKSSGMWWSGGGPCFAPWDADGTEDALSGDVHIPALAGVTDPTEALALIVRHLWPPEQA